MSTKPTHRTLKKLLIGDDGSVTLRFKGSSRLVAAQALEIRRNAAGEPTYLCLDRLVHKPSEDELRLDMPEMPLSSIMVTGCVATEMHLH